MQTATNNPDVAGQTEPAPTRPVRAMRTLRTGLTGLGLGLAAATTYLALGGEYIFNIPRWAAIVFYPGFLVGYKVNEWGAGKDTSKVLGVVAVGLSYAAVAMLFHKAMRSIRKRASTR